MYAKVIIDSNSRFLNRPFTYRIPENLNKDLKKAMRVLVPFGRGNKTSVAFVYDIVSKIEAEFEVKDIISIIDDNRLISEELLELAFYMHRTYLSPIQLSLRTVMPPTRIDRIQSFYIRNSNKDKEILTYLNSKKSKKDLYNNFKAEDIEKLIKNQDIRVLFETTDTQKISYESYIYLKEDKDISLPKNAKKQKDIIKYLQNEGITEKSELLKNTKSSSSSLKSLIDKEIVGIQKKEKKKNIVDNVKDYGKHKLNSEQLAAYRKIRSNPEGQFLLFGVTGSGKTEIFLQVIEDILSEGKEAIILVPEISLTPQTIERFAGRFKQKIAIMHSRLTPKEKFDQWRMINNGEVKIVIGARSAIFAPFKNLGAIIIDEEHDKSYISSKDPKYHTKDIARFRANYHKANLILASATPSIETMSEAKEGQLEVLKLNKRINKKMPSISIVDMREELKKSNYSMLSRRLQEEIKNNLENKEQTILFLNKIGHDSFTFCRACGYVAKCEACDVAMTYHKNVDRLVCHYCGRTRKQLRVCPNCHSKKIKEFGAGTEKLEEEVRYLFPKARILRMDSMVATNKAKYDNMYKLMKENKVDILLGTQMIAKGLDFDNVTLVGIVSADLSLNVGDFASQEISFQLLTQVSGRAGRAKKEGRAIIQTYSPDNFVIQSVKNNDYKSFFVNEIKIRESFSYPPFKNLVSIRVINENRVKTVEISKKFADKLRFAFKDKINIEIIGPNPCKISRINNKFRYNILLKVDDEDLELVRSRLSVLRNIFIDKYKSTSFIIAINPANIN